MSSPVLIGDIGGTNVRFAFAEQKEGGFTGEQSYRCADFPTLVDAIQFYLGQTGAPMPQSIYLAAAGPIVAEAVKLTNNPWSISIAGLHREFGCETIRLLNDFEAIAYSIPALAAHELLQVGEVKTDPLDASDYTLAVIGPGTGLGAVGLRRHAGGFFTIVGEASHGGFSPETSEQIELLKVLQGLFERVSSERLVSGPGLENLFQGLALIHAEKRSPLGAAEIFQASIDEGDPLARRAVDLFYEILGQVAGDLALTLGASHGVYLAGGIARRYPEQLVSSRFREGFEAKGRHRLLMERIPTQLVLHQQAGLLGASILSHQTTT